jgi:hypothetical protein
MEPALTTLTEMTLGASMAVAIEDLQEGRLALGDTIGYARTQTGHDDLCPVAVSTASGPAPLKAP